MCFFSRSNSSWSRNWTTSLPRPRALWLIFTFMPNAVRNCCSKAAMCSLFARDERLALAGGSTAASGSRSAASIVSWTSSSVWRTFSPSRWIRWAELDLLAFVAQGQQRPGVALGDSAAANGFLHRLGQFQQPDQVGDGRAVELQSAGQLLLRAAVLVEVFLERGGLFQRVEVFALQVFDDGQLGHLAVVGLDHVDRHVDPAGLDRRPKPPLAGHQLVAFVHPADHHRLQQPVGRNALGQRLHFVGREVLARLGRVAVDLVNARPAWATTLA